ncbi:AraC family transcriptional regulator, regulatory protein of adaptative response / methylated-DNA-[protein]-cysteine methyltransferase [Cupriavidus metallidurans]
MALAQSIDIGRKNRSACDGKPAYSGGVIDDDEISAMKTTIAYETEDDRWTAVQARDAGADGHFVYAVRTTGVYCQPSSSARLPKRENVEFFDSAEIAEAAGYRCSRRAHGDQTSAAAERAALVARACRMIEASETPPQLDDLATAIGMSPFHFHRLFKAETGLTPKAYSSAYRARKLREELSSPEASITNAIYDSGFNSNSRFYEASDQLLGMRARDYRSGGVGAVIRFAVGQCSLGAILVAQSQRGICAILLGDDPDQLVRDLQDQFRKAEIVGCDGKFEQLIAQVVGFIEAPAMGLHLPLDVQGTAFQERVWRALREIPPGTTVSYAEIAERIGSPKAVRAVAQACATNHIAVAIPCHRVVRRDGDLAGYRWGVDRKRELLRRETQV